MASNRLKSLHERGVDGLMIWRWWQVMDLFIVSKKDHATSCRGGCVAVSDVIAYVQNLGHLEAVIGGRSVEHARCRLSHH